MVEIREPEEALHRAGEKEKKCRILDCARKKFFEERAVKWGGEVNAGSSS